MTLPSAPFTSGSERLHCVSVVGGIYVCKYNYVQYIFHKRGVIRLFSSPESSVVAFSAGLREK